MSSVRPVKGLIVQGPDAYYFLPESRLDEFRVEGDAAQQLAEWLASDDVSGHSGGSGAESVTRVEFEAAEQDDDVEGFRKAFDPLVGNPGYRRRCLNVVPDDVLDLLEKLDIRS